jgi:hypothetical protein
MKSNTYLCVSKTNSFECKLFESFQKADSYFNQNYNATYNSTIVPVCAYTPLVVQEYILKRKLNKYFDVTSVKIEN